MKTPKQPLYHSETMRPISLLLTTLVLLTACTPHPGAGGWGATSSDAAFARLEIRYNGQAEFFTNAGDHSPAWRCFWGGENKFRTNMKCINAANDQDERVFILLVDENRQQAELLQGQQSLGQYAWQPPTGPAEE